MDQTGPNWLKPVLTGSHRTQTGLDAQTGVEQLKPDQPAQPDQTGSDRLKPDQTGPDRLKPVLTGSDPNRKA